MNRTRGDFTADFRLLNIAVIAIVIGSVCSVVAVVLLKLIDVFTNVFYYGALSLEHRIPAGHGLGWWLVLIPVAGGLIIGLMARFGSERIRGHGIPEAMEAILIGQSRMQPKVAVLKPLSSAISIGSGGPFGAEGPIIMTGGSLRLALAQAFHLTAAERKTLLVAGAAGGMSATFGTPVAAVLLAVELLLFEWKPRSLIPVALASFVAALLAAADARAGPCSPCRRMPRCPARRTVCVALVGLWPALLPCCSRWPSMPPKTCSTGCRSTGCGGRPSAAWSSASAACPAARPGRRLRHHRRTAPGRLCSSALRR